MFQVRWGGIKGFAKNMTRLNKLAEGAYPLEVGYEAPYALPVHENMSLKHTPPGQAKFLEQAFRVNKRKMINDIVTGLKKAKKDPKPGKTFAKLLLDGAKLLKNESLKLVPVDTGCLKKSWFIIRVGGRFVSHGSSYGQCDEGTRSLMKLKKSMATKKRKKRGS